MNYLEQLVLKTLHFSLLNPSHLPVSQDMLKPRLAPSLCISHSTKLDTYGIIMNPPDEWGPYA